MQLAVGDFRGDGKLDLVVTNYALATGNTVSVLLGNGDGTFQPQVSYATAPVPFAIAIGDFNGDGNLDLAVTANPSNPVVSILLGNGDGTFQPQVDYPGGGVSIATGDFNGDGNLDLVTVSTNFSISVLLGNGNGTFQAPVSYPWQFQSGLVATGDFNGDGKLDLVTGGGDEVALWLGNGDGTFQLPINYLLANAGLIVGDFNGDGVPDLAATGVNAVEVLLSTPFKAVSPTALNFGSQGVSTTSPVQTLTISNPSNTPFNIVSVTASTNFSETNNCGATLAPGTNCTVSVTFSPSAVGLEQGTITIVDSTRISPTAISLSGTGVSGSFVTPFPARVNFSPQIVGSSSAPATIMLMNTGNASVSLIGISISGTNSSDFSQTNNCGAALTASGSCNVNVTFAPSAGGTRMAALAISDTAPGSPQEAVLVGSGLAPDFQIAVSPLSPATITAGDSANAMVTVTSANGFNSPVALSCAGLPSGASCGFNPASLGDSGASALAVTTTRTTAAGTYSVNITGTSGSLAHNASVSLVVQAALNFTVSATTLSPATITAGSSATSTITAASTAGFNAAVTFSCSSITLGGTRATSAPPTCSFNPTSLAGATGSSTLTVSSTGNTTLLNPARKRSGLFYALCLPFLGLALMGAQFSSRSGKKNFFGVLPIYLIALGVLLMAGCGSSSSRGGGGGGADGSTPAGTYTITVTGTAGSTISSTTLSLVVQ